MANSDKEQITLYLSDPLGPMMQELADKNERPRNTEIEIAIRKHLLDNMIDTPEFWDEVYQKRKEPSKL